MTDLAFQDETRGQVVSESDSEMERETEQSASVQYAAVRHSAVTMCHHEMRCVSPHPTSRVHGTHTSRPETVRVRVVALGVFYRV